MLHAFESKPARSLYHRIVPLTARKTVHSFRCWAGLTQPDVSPIDTFAQPPHERGFDRHQCIFIHIPKCAGISILRGIGDVYPEHIPYSEFKAKDPERFDNYFKFAFVRNPWDRLVSSYTFLKKGGLTSEDQHWGEQVIDKYSSFDSFILDWLDPDHIETKIHFVPQHRFICDQDGRLRMDYLGRFEELRQGWDHIGKKLGIASELPHLNRSRHRPYTEFYTPETRDRVAEVYARDIELFGYTFNGT